MTSALRRQTLTGSASSAPPKRRWRRWLFSALGLLFLLPILAILAFYAAANLRETRRVADLAPSTGRLVPTSQGSLFVQEAGPADGPPVVLIHGTAAWSELWRETIDRLATEGFRVVALDVPPFGFSTRPADDGYTRERQAARIAALIDALQLNRAILVGHSFGAGPTVETVLRHSGKVGGLVLIAGALGISDPAGPSAPPALLTRLLATPALRDPLVASLVTNPITTRMLLGTMVHRKEAITPRRVAVLQRPMTLRDSTPGLGRWLRYFVSVDANAWSMDRGRYGAIKLPTALIWGDKDTLTPLAQAEDLRKLMPAASLTVLPGVGHIPQIEDPPALGTALIAALRRITAKP